MMTEDNKKFFEEISEILHKKFWECNEPFVELDVKVKDVFSTTCGDRDVNGIAFRLNNNPLIDLEIYNDGTFELWNLTETDNIYWDEKINRLRYADTNELVDQKGIDIMNNNKIFTTDTMKTEKFAHFCRPKDAKTNLRVAKVGAGVVILPDNGSPITASEIVKALGLKDVEPEVEKEKKQKYIMRNNYDCGVVFYISLTESQVRLLEWFEHEGVFAEDYTIEYAGNVEFEEI